MPEIYGLNLRKILKMRIIKNIAAIFLLSTTSILIFSCGNNQGTEKVEAPAISANDTAAVEGKITLTLEGNDLMKYNKKELRAKTGVTIRLVLVHTGKIPKNAMGHNVVILKEGTDVSEFVNKAASAVGTDYIPESHKDKIIAHTRMIGGGEFDAVEFAIDKPGSYVYLCSFPGHSAIMRGILIVEE